MTTDADKTKAAILVAERMAERVKTAYVESVKRQLHAYDAMNMPCEDDFMAWVEGYDWQQPK